MSHARVLNRQTMMWLPAAALLTAALLAATGFRVTPPSYAATNTTTVSANVGAELHIGTGAGQCGGGVYSGVSISPGANAALATCTLTFGSNNNAAGVNIRVESTRPSGADTFCQAAITSACTAGATTFTNVATTGILIGSLTNGGYGVHVTGTPTCSTPTWASGSIYGIGAADTAGAGNLICSQSGTTDGSYPLAFTARGDASKTAGTYTTNAQFTVAAN